MVRTTGTWGRRGMGLALWLVMAVGGVCLPACADPAGPGTRDRLIAKNVTFLLGRDHLTKHKLDAEMSRRGMGLFLKALDPLKLYFYQADIDNFKTREDMLDELARKDGDVSFAHEAFAVYLKRVDARVAMAEKALAMTHDFTVDEEMVRDPDAATYARNEAEAMDRWRKKVKFDLLVLKADKKLVGREAIDKLKKRYTSMAKRVRQTDSYELLEIYLSSLTGAFDPHTSYMAPDTSDNFDIDMKLQLAGGIGAALQSEDGSTIVKEIIIDGPADKDGRLKIGDTIAAVGDGTEGPMEDVQDMKLPYVVKLIRGKPGTVVRLEVIPADGGQRKVVDIKREKVELKGREAQSAVFEEGRKPDGKPYRVGVIDLPSFYMDMTGARLGVLDYRSTTRDVRRILEGFKAQGVDAVILDLRRNGGGSLQEAINLTGLFIDEGPVVQVKDSDGRVTPYNDIESGAVWTGPLAVLISKFSASASEILAGAIQDYRRGLIVGDRSTHGKGTVQSLMDLGQQLYQMPNAPRLGALKITIQQFYRPNGDSTQNRGVLADIELPSLISHLDVSESDLDYALAFDRVQAAQYRPLSDVDAAIRDHLKRRSEERTKASKDFQEVNQGIQRYLEQKQQKTVTLHEEKFMAQMKQINAEKEEQEKLDQTGQKRDAIKRDFYMNEALAIVVDYLQLKVVARAK